MLVKAIRECFVGGSLRREGERFDWKGEGDLPRHLEPIDPTKPEPAVEEPDEIVIAGKRARVVKTLKDAAATVNPPVK